MPERLPPQPGEWIDRARPIRFWFEEAEVTGFAGDTISSALWANGIRTVGRSFKYHRPRGILSLADQDANCVVETEFETNIRADMTQVREGLRFSAVNTLGGLLTDRARVMNKFSSFLPVGFYYKAFHTPRRLFPFYERKMREMAGLGQVNPKNRLLPTPKRYGFCDVLVIGAGPAGLAAGIAAAEENLKVIIVDENPHPGGSLSYMSADGAEPASMTLRKDLLAKVSTFKNLELRSGTTAVGYYADHWVALVDSVCMTKVRAKCVVVASGCYEQPAVFRNNDLPGVMLASAAQRLIHQFAVKPLHEAVVLTANEDGYKTALDLSRAGTRVAALVDMRPDEEHSEVGELVKREGIPIHTGKAVYEATPNKAHHGIQQAVLCSLDRQGNPLSDNRTSVNCDGVVMSVGWMPADGILRQARTRMRYSEALEQFIPESLPSGIFAAGRVNGVYDLPEQLEDGERAGKSAAKHLGVATGRAFVPATPVGPARSHPYPIIHNPEGKNFVDFDEDIQLKDFENAVQEGFDSMELLKRYTTFGMGPSQGKHSNLNTARILARIQGRSLEGAELTTARPFTTPVALNLLAGRSFSPHRQSPLHERHQLLGARFMYAGNWLRPEYYERSSMTRRETIEAEVQAVRTGVGLIDVGTLGKLEISGSDAVAFVERMYTGKFANLKVGMTRYVLMCDESGVMIDDGVAARLGPNRFYVTTTTGGSDAIAREMKRWAIIWGMKTTIVNLTGTLAAINLAGPRSREVLEKLTTINLSPEGFPYLGVREGEIAGVESRVLRVGFVGELGYEIHIPADSAVWVWDQLSESGKAAGIRPFGVEAQRTLRLEKGHIIIGQDSDGLTHPFEARMGWAVKAEKEFFIGQRSLSILAGKPLTRSLIGFALPPEYAGPMPKECHLIIDGGEIAGRVTSVLQSPTIGQVIGLAYVRPQQSTPGSTFSIRVDGGAMVQATVVRTPFYDPENERQKISASEQRPA